MTRALVVLSIVGVSFAALAAEPPASQPAPPNVVQLEMQGLTTAMQAVLLAVANNQLEQVQPAIMAVHPLRDNTAAALKKKAWAPPKNPGDLAAFIAEDDAFHDELVKLVQAAHKKDLPAATKQLGVIIEGCTTCHTKYRF